MHLSPQSPLGVLRSLNMPGAADHLLAVDPQETHVERGLARGGRVSICHERRGRGVNATTASVTPGRATCTAPGSNARLRASTPDGPESAEDTGSARPGADTATPTQHVQRRGAPLEGRLPTDATCDSARRNLDVEPLCPRLSQQRSSPNPSPSPLYPERVGTFRACQSMLFQFQRACPSCQLSAFKANSVSGRVIRL